MIDIIRAVGRALTKLCRGATRAIRTTWRHIRRMILGAGRTLAAEDTRTARLERPFRRTLRAFLHRRVAVIALLLLLTIFLFVFVGSWLLPMESSFTDAGQASLSPTLSMRRVPLRLRREGVRSISGFGAFTIGVSRSNTLYMWGNTHDALRGYDYAALPDEVQAGEVLSAAAGADFAVAVTTAGRVVAWGDNSRGQLGYLGADTNEDDPLVTLPASLLDDGIDPRGFLLLTAGYQAAALVTDTAAYVWGNYHACRNLRELAAYAATGAPVRKAALSGYYGLFLLGDGTVASPGYNLSREYVTDRAGQTSLYPTALDGRRVVDIAATKNTFALVLEDGDVLVQGAAEWGEDEIAEIPPEEKVISIAAGTYHYVAATDAGHAYMWGLNAQKQCRCTGETCAAAYAGAYQTYLADAEGDIVCAAGLRGYLFGTDTLGRDVLRRVIHGGRMTMTVGVVAVLVSTCIAIAVGCSAGYFGGRTDLLLMRVTEVFASIPFLPFAMLLSYVLTYTSIGENTRILLIMVILGVLSFPAPARMIRGQVLAEREKESVLAARAMGVREMRIAFRHVLPNVFPVILVSMTLDLAGCLLTESSLSYLGFGVRQPEPTWGNMLSSANSSLVIRSYPWQWLTPAIFLAVTAICINVIGDTLRDVLDPRHTAED